MLVRVDEPMRVAPDGHVTELKAGETVTGALADYLVASRCNVTVLDVDGESEASEDPAPKPAKAAKATAK